MPDKSRSSAILEWLGYSSKPEFLKARWLGTLLGFLLASVTLLLVIASLATLLSFLAVTFGYGIPANSTQHEAIRNIGLVLAGIISAPFIVWRTFVAQKQVNVAEQSHITDRISKAVEQLGAEKVVKTREFRPKYKMAGGKFAKDDAGNPIPAIRPDGDPMGEWDSIEETVPNIEVRIGGVYALERIAQDSVQNDRGRDHVQIMEILCAYIRENAPADGAKKLTELMLRANDEDQTLLPDWKKTLDDYKSALKNETAKLHPRADIAVALQVIGRRSADQLRVEARWGNTAKGHEEWAFATPAPAPPKAFVDDHAIPKDAFIAYESKIEDWIHKLHDSGGYLLDLRNTNLQGANLCEMSLGGAQFSHARLEGVNLAKANLRCASFSHAYLDGANLSGSHMEGAYFWEAFLTGAIFWETNLVGAIFRRSRLEGIIVQDTQMYMANLSNTHLEGAHFADTFLVGADLSEAHMEGAMIWQSSLEGANLDQAHLEGAFLYNTILNATTNLNLTKFQGASWRFVDCFYAPISDEQVNSLFGDGSIILPDGMPVPAHWPREQLNDEDFVVQFQVWLKSVRPLQATDLPPKVGNLT